MSDPLATLQRLLRRDELVRKTGKIPEPRAEKVIIDFIVQHDLYSVSEARGWMTARASTSDYFVAKRVIDSLIPLLDRDFGGVAHAMFRTLLGLDHTDGGEERRDAMLGRHSLFRKKLEALLARPRLISESPDTWGRTLIYLQAILLLEHQQRERGRTTEARTSISELPGESIAPKAHHEPEYDDHPQIWYYQYDYALHEPRGLIAQVIERALTEAASFSTPDYFRLLADNLIESRWALAVGQPLVALYDVSRSDGWSTWQKREAIRLLGNLSISIQFATHSWRRLLRRQLLPVPHSDERNRILRPIRECVVNDSLRVNELVDLESWRELSSEERHLIENARKSDELYEPIDPRELRSEAGRFVWTRDDKMEDPASRWPHDDDRTRVRELIAEDRVPGELEDREFGRTVTNKLSALEHLLRRSEATNDEWRGTMMGWCVSAIKDLKCWRRRELGLGHDDELPPEDYFATLRQHADWWRQQFGLAIDILASGIPSSHIELDPEFLGWGSNDPFAQSLAFMDELLAVASGTPLDDAKKEMAETIRQSWPNWPPYSRGLAFRMLRTYHWAQSATLTALLIELLEQESDSIMLEHALRHVMLLGRVGTTSLLQQIHYRLANLSEPNKIAHLIGCVLGNAYMRCEGAGESSTELGKLAAWSVDLRTQPGTHPSMRGELLSGILWSALDHSRDADGLTDSYADAWLSVAGWGFNEWLDSEPLDKRHLPISPVRDLWKLSWPTELRRRIVQETGELVVRIISDGSLAEFHDIHFHLRQVLGADDSAEADSEDEARITSSIRECLSDDLLIDLCRASAHRVARWVNEQKHSEDLVWGGSTNGIDTAELIKQTIEYSGDRQLVRRGLAAVIDILADAGLLELATELRLALRRH